MWSDPIDNALGQIQTLLWQLTDGSAPTADNIERAKRAADHARKVRAFEWEHDRLVTYEDRI